MSIIGFLHRSSDQTCTALSWTIRGELAALSLLPLGGNLVKCERINDTESSRGRQTRITPLSVFHS